MSGAPSAVDDSLGATSKATEDIEKRMNKLRSN